MAKSRRWYYQLRRIITYARSRTKWLTIKHLRDRIHQRDYVLFFRQLATLIQAGVPIIEALRILAGNHHKKTFKHLMAALRQQLLRGRSLACTLSDYPHHFDPWISHLINLGEHTGKLSDILTAIAQQQEKQWQLQKRFIEIIFYPCLLSGVSLLVLLFLLLIIVPQFQSFLTEVKTELPLLTQGIFLCSHLLRIAGIPVFVLSLGIFFFPMTKAKPHNNLTTVFRQLPLFRSFKQKSELAVWCDRLALALAAGVPITQALALLSKFEGEITRKQYDAIHENLIGGEPFHRALAAQQFPLLLVQMTKIGEESGQLELMLQKVGEFYKTEAEQALTFFCQLLDPLIMLGLGALIGVLLIGIYLPIFNLGTRI